jgi:hypothetical protein
VTVMTTLTNAEKMKLLVAQMPLCKTVAQNPDALRRAGVPEKKIKGIIAESTQLCGL